MDHFRLYLLASISTQNDCIFATSVLISVGGETNMSIAQNGLNRAVKFYPDGFIIINDSINELINGNTIENKRWNPKTDFWWPLMEHLMFASVFWLITISGYANLF